MTLADELLADAYFMRRLATVRRFQALPTSVQFDMARSPIPDDDLDQVGQAFGTPVGSEWGIGDVLHELLSAQPRSVAIRDLRTYQENLQRQGYLPPSYNPTGTWDDLSYSASKRFERDNVETQRSGKGFLSGPIEAGMRLVTNTLPSTVWQATVGSARGLVKQAPETAERAGLAGGLLGGVAIGALAGSVFPGPGTAIGTVAGAAIGGLSSFFADLLGEDVGEEDQSGWENVIDALSPYDEYVTRGKQGVRAFYEDLGFVATAASLLSGAKIAALKFGGGLAAARSTARPGVGAALQGAPTELAVTSGAPFSLTAPTGPGVGGLLEAAVRHPIAAGAIAGGVTPLFTTPDAGFTDVLEGAAVGAVVGLAARATLNLRPGSNSWITAFRTRHNLQTRPIFKMANGIYTGTTAGSLGARFSAGFSIGAGEYETTLEKSIAETEPLNGLVDVAALVLWPEQWFPFKSKQLAAGVGKMLGDEGLRPVVHLLQRQSPGMGFFAARNLAHGIFDGQPALWAKTRLDHAVAMEAIKVLETTYRSERRQFIEYRRAVANIRRKILDEVETTGGTSSTANRILKESEADLERFEAWLIHEIGIERPFADALPKWVDAQEYALKWEEEARRLGTLVDEAPNGLTMSAVPGGAFRPVSKTVVPPGYQQEGVSQLALQSLERQVRVEERYLRLVERASARTGDPLMIARNSTIQDLHNASLSSLRRQLDDLRASVTKRKRLAEETHIVVAREDTMTRSMYFDARRQYVRLRDELDAAKTRANAPGAIDMDIALLGQKQSEFDQFVWNLSKRDAIPDRVRDRALRNPNSDAVPNILEVNGAVSARDVELPPDAMQYLKERGYKPVVTGDEVFFPHQMDAIVGALDIPGYTNRRWFIDTIGFSPRYATERSLYNITWANMQAELTQVFEARGVPLKGAQAIRILEAYLMKVNSAARVETGFAAAVKQQAQIMRRIDIRRLKPEEVEAAFAASRVPGITGDVPFEIYQALKRGSGFGEDLHLIHPFASAKVAARALRTAGWPGFAQFVRTAHAHDPRSLPARLDVLKATDLAYTSVTSTERARVVSEMRTSAGRAGLSVEEAREGERFLDVMADAATRFNPERYGDVDAFFKDLSVEYLTKYMGKEGDLEKANQFVIRIYGDATFDSLVQEGGHLLRRILPDDAMKAVEARYGVKAGEWIEKAEKALVDDFTNYVLGKLRGNISPLDHIQEAVASLWGRSREALLAQGLVPFQNYRLFNTLFKDSLTKAGIRRPSSTVVSRPVIAGAIIGAGEGLYAGDQGATDILRGAALGAVAGLGVKTALKRTYGYLPDALSNLNMALRYTLSFTFDAGRYVEQNIIAAEKYGLPFVLAPRRHAIAREWRSPYSTGTVHGTEAWDHIQRFFDEMNGTNYFQRLSETEHAMFQRGMLGFSPRNHEAVQAFYLYQRGWGEDAIREAVAQIGRYGLGRTVAERSANFIFFPFSFSKKLITTLGDFVLQVPGRNFLIHEGLRRYHDSLLDEQFHSLLEDRAPLLEQLWMVNNLAFGMSLGRFFLEGIDDRRTNVGRVAQALASVFVPSGAATPLQQAAGALGDLSVNAFVPVVLTGESISRAGGIDGVDDIIRRYVPMVREIENYARSASDQRVAILSPQHMTPWSQFQEYVEGIRAEKDSIEPMARAFGYANSDTFMASPAGLMWRLRYEKTQAELRDQYPQGWEITTTFENEQAIDAAAVLELAGKPDKTPGEEAMVQLLQQREVLKVAYQYLPEDLARMLEQGSIRSSAARWVDDRRFAELWARFMWRDYGPIRMAA